MRRYFDQRITSLSMCEIFVFGSNPQGLHIGGASQVAHEKFGAEWGVGSGPTGRCYAIPTTQCSLNEIKRYVDEFTEYAKAHPNNRFLVTRIGCGNAGYSDKLIAPLFKEAWKLPNVNVSKSWLTKINFDELADVFLTGIAPEKKPIPIPSAITEIDIVRLCEKYKYVIGNGVIVPLPKINIRYVIDRDRFGYANFGEFFLCRNGELYVWSSSEEFATKHEQHKVEAIFGDECFGRLKYFHRAIFAGVETSIRDYKGRPLFTGDVIRVWLKGLDGTPPKKFYKKDSMLLALGTLGENTESWNATYACVLDNHCVIPDMCARIKWEGTVFFQLDWSGPTIEVAQRCLYFHNIHGSSKLSMKDKEVLVKYTPNFDKELWKYHANKILGIEFNTK